MLLRAKDVNHQFAVPQFRVKMDMVPGMVTHFWFTPTRTGEFDVLCEQLCGVAHFAMRGRVVVDDAGRLSTSWLAAQPTFEQIADAAKGDPAAGQALFAPCTACHGAQAEGNRELNAPKLSGQSDWYLARQLQSFKSGVRGSHEKDIYAQTDDAVRVHARRRHGDQQRGRLYQDAAGSAARRERGRQSGARQGAL